MGLLDIFLQNQSNLDITPIPPQGNGPIGTPTGEFNTGTTPFVQTWDSNNTYISSFEGGTNTGIQPSTLTQTGLDVDNPTAVPSTTIPDTLTIYPATALGGLGQSAVQFLQIWTPIINYNDVVVGASTSPLEQSLDQTGLDVENNNAVPTTTIPTDPTLYPQFVQGEFNGAPLLYIQNWNPNNGYFSIFNPTTGNTKQIVTLGQTGLDNTDSNLLPGASTPTPVPVSPSQIPPQTYMGEFQDVAQPFIQYYNPSVGGGYLDTYNNIIANAMTNAQVKTIIDPNKYGTGLDNTNPQASQTTFIPIPVGIPAAPVILPPQTFMGEFQGGAQQFNPQYNPNLGQSYLDNYTNIIDNNTNPQVNTLDETGLDVENNNAAPTTYIVPTTDDTFSTGDVPLYVHAPLAINNSAPRNYTQTWLPNNEETKYYDYMRNNFQLNYL